MISVFRFGGAFAALFFLIASAQAQYSFTKIVAQGDILPRGQFGDLSDYAVNNQGQVAFSAPSGFNPPALYVGDGSMIKEIAANGTPIPGGGNFLGQFGYGITNNGVVAFNGATPFGVPGGVFTSKNGVIRPIVRQGDATPDGETFDSIYTANIAQNEEITLLAGVGNADFGLYRSANGALSTLARTGDAVDNGKIALDAPFLSVDASGAVAFRSTQTREGQSDRYGVFVIGAGGIQSVAYAGDAAPGGGVFSSLLSDRPVISGGKVAFSSFLEDGTSGVYEWDGANLTAIARQGDAAPGGGTFGFLGPPSLNSAGDILFSASVLGGGSAESAAFLFHDSGIRRLFGTGDAAFSDQFESVLTDERSLADNGAIAFRYSLTNRTLNPGIALATAAPEPATLMLLLPLFLAFLTPRRRSFGDQGIVDGGIGRGSSSSRL